MMTDWSGEAERRLAQTESKLAALGLPLHRQSDGKAKRRGGLLIKESYKLDSYISYKSPGREAVNLSIVQRSVDEEPSVWVHRRSSVSGKLKTVGVDQLPIRSYPLAENLFLATASALAAAGYTWSPSHPGDE